MSRISIILIGLTGATLAWSGPASAGDGAPDLPCNSLCQRWMGIADQQPAVVEPEAVRPQAPVEITPAAPREARLTDRSAEPQKPPRLSPAPRLAVMPPHRPVFEAQKVTASVRPLASVPLPPLRPRPELADRTPAARARSVAAATQPGTAAEVAPSPQIIVELPPEVESLTLATAPVADRVSPSRPDPASPPALPRPGLVPEAVVANPAGAADVLVQLQPAAPPPAQSVVAQTIPDAKAAVFSGPPPFDVIAALLLSPPVRH